MAHYIGLPMISLVPAASWQPMAHRKTGRMSILPLCVGPCGSMVPFVVKVWAQTLLRVILWKP